MEAVQERKAELRMRATVPPCLGFAMAKNGLPLVEELLTRKPYPAPKLWLDPGVTDFYAFTTDHLRLEGYQCHELGEKIPVAI